MTLLLAWLAGTPAAPHYDTPPTSAFLEEVKHCWVDPRPSAHQSRDARTLTAMRNAGEHGLVNMPTVDQCIALLVLSPDEALKNNTHCPRPQCRVMDSLLSKAYDTPAFLEELKRCWVDPRPSAHQGRDTRTLASMRNAGEHDLVNMPSVDQCISSLVLSPDEALKDNTRCPRPQCRVKDSLLLKAYATAACMACWDSCSPTL